MERTITLIATGLAAAPAFYLAGWFLVARYTRGAVGSDQTIAAGYLGLVLGFVCAMAGFLLVWFLARRFLTPGLLRPVQIVDTLVVIGWFVAWNRVMAPTPSLEYPEHRAVLEIEVRVDDSLLGGRPVTSALAISFVGGEDLSLEHPEGVRTEAGVTILPWETTPITLNAWEIRVGRESGASLFRLDLPKRPPQSTEWSEWTAPVALPDYVTPEGLSLRYRFLLVPHGAR